MDFTNMVITGLNKKTTYLTRLAKALTSASLAKKSSGCASSYAVILPGREYRSAICATRQ